MPLLAQLVTQVIHIEQPTQITRAMKNNSPLGILLYNIQPLQLFETVSGNGTTAPRKMRRSDTITLPSTINLSKCTHAYSLPQVDLPCHGSFTYMEPQNNTMRQKIQYSAWGTKSPENVLHEYNKRVNSGVHTYQL